MANTTTTDNYKALVNNSGGQIVHGMLVRASANRGFVLAQADSAPHLAGFIGVNGSGTVGPGGVANIFSSGASVDVLLDVGLAPAAGNLIFVSSLTAGRGTTTAPALSVPIGTIEDASAYGTTGLVTVALSISAGAATTASGSSVTVDSVNTAGVTLTGLASAGFTAGTLAKVISVDAYFTLQQSAFATDNITVVNASGKAGFQWVRETSWSCVFSAKQTAWFLNSGTGSDEAIGTAAGTPLATWAELRRRLYGAIIGTVTVTIQADMATGDSMILDGVIGTLTVLGTVNVTNTLTVTSAQARSASGNLANEITVTGFDFSGMIGTLLRVQGTNNYATIIKAPSLGVARLSELWDTVGNLQASATGIAGGATVETVNQTRGATNLRIHGSRLIYTEVDVKRTSGITLNITDNAPIAIFSRCPVTGGNVSLTGSQLNFQCCPWNNGALIGGGPLQVLSDGAAFTGTGAIAFQGQLWVLRSAMFQAKGCSIADGVMFEHKGDFGVFDLPAAANGVLMTNMARYVNVSGGLFYGGGNDAASTGFALKTGSTCFAGVSIATLYVANMGHGINTAAGNVAFGPVGLATADGTAFYGT